MQCAPCGRLLCICSGNESPFLIPCIPCGNVSCANNNLSCWTYICVSSFRLHKHVPQVIVQHADQVQNGLRHLEMLNLSSNRIEDDGSVQKEFRHYRVSEASALAFAAANSCTDHFCRFVLTVRVEFCGISQSTRAHIHTYMKHAGLCVWECA